jgi:hypothetical protein
MEAVMTVAEKSTDNQSGNARSPEKSANSLLSFEEFLLDILKKPEHPSNSSKPRKSKRKQKFSR